MTISMQSSNLGEYIFTLLSPLKLTSQVKNLILEPEHEGLRAVSVWGPALFPLAYEMVKKPAKLVCHLCALRTPGV